MKKHLIILILPILLFTSDTGNFNHNVMAGQRSITLVTTDFSPHFGPDLRNQGYFSEITKEAFELAGYDCKIIFMPWKRAFELSKKGKYDGLIGVFFSKDRTRFFHFSDPVAEVTMAFFTKKEKAISYKSLNDLAPYKIGYIFGYHYTEEFNAADYLVKIKAYNSETNIKLLLRDRIDIIIDSATVVNHLMNNNFTENKYALKMIEPHLTTSKMYIGISKKINNYNTIVNDFNRGMTRLKKEGRFKLIMKKHN